MPKRRIPKRRVVSPRAIELFKLWRVEEDPAARAALEQQLHAALELRPWQDPPVIHPDEPCTGPAGTAAAEWHPQGQALYLILAHAAHPPSARL